MLCGKYIKNSSGTLPKLQDESDQPEQNKMISFQVVRSVGVGSTGKVYLCRQADSPAQKFVLKKITANLEVQALRSLGKHDQIVSLQGIIDKQYMALEWIPGLELFDMINQGELKTSTISTIFWLLVDTLEYIHTRGWVHGDIKPENIMVMESEIGELTIKLIDFGMSRSASNACKGIWGSLEYAPPEMLRDEHYDPIKAEMWSVGVVLHTMVHRCFPCDFKNNECPNSASAHDIIIADLLNPDPLKRPTCSELKNKYA